MFFFKGSHSFIVVTATMTATMRASMNGSETYKA